MKTIVSALVVVAAVAFAGAAEAQQMFYSGASCVPQTENTSNTLYRRWGQLYNSSTTQTVTVVCPVTNVTSASIQVGMINLWLYLADRVNPTSCYADGTTAGRAGVFSPTQTLSSVGYAMMAWTEVFRNATSYLGIETVCHLGGNSSSIQGYIFQP